MLLVFIGDSLIAAAKFFAAIFYYYFGFRSIGFLSYISSLGYSLCGGKRQDISAYLFSSCLYVSWEILVGYHGADVCTCREIAKEYL